MTNITVHHGDCLDVLRGMEAASVDAVVTDPPYGLSATSTDDVIQALTAWLAGKEYRKKGGGFMGRTWDAFVPGPEVWREVLRVLKPGGHAVVFAGTRTADLMGVALRIAGFEIRDSLHWLTGQGFPKSLNVSVAIDKAAGAEREVIGVREDFASRANKKPHSCNAIQSGLVNPQTVGQITAPAIDAAKQWQGWGSALKPAHEPIILARRPLAESTIAAQVLATGTGAINVDGCRVATGESTARPGTRSKGGILNVQDGGCTRHSETHEAGRWPPNILHDGSPEVLEAFGRFGPRGGGFGVRGMRSSPEDYRMPGRGETVGHGDAPGNAARFFPALGFTDDELRFHYSAKAGRRERGDSKHPTVKPLALMQWLCRLITPSGGTVLDPFAGSGTTGEAALRESFNAILIEREAEYLTDIQARIERAQAASPPEPSHPDLFAEETAA